MGIFGRSQNIIKTAEYLHKASPVFVHLLMIVGVAVYTLFGAVVMRNLESKVAEETRTVEKRTSRSIFEKGIKTNLTVKQHSLRHSRSYFYKNETGFNFTELINSQTINEKSRRDLANIMRSRQCVIGTLQKFIDFDCSESVMHSQILKLLDSCYHVTVDNQKEFENIEFLHSLDELKITNVEKKEYIKPWSFSDSVLFAFTVITTIGYGNVAPKTFNGRLFCIFYGLIGIPFTLLAIADLGKFISEVIDSWENTCKKFYKKLKKRYDKAFKKDGLKQSFSNGSVNQNIQTPNGISKNVDEEFKPLTKDKSSIFDVTTIEANDNILEDTRTGEYIEADLERGPEIPTESPKKSTGTTSEEEMEQSQALSLLIFFVMYTFVGAALLSAYEPDMTFFKAIYFNFVSLSSIGLGDIYPKSETYMAFTIVYIAIGLALTTIAIEIAADYLKKLHYFGRKIENVGNVAIWFGGKKLTMKQLVRNLGDQFNLPIHTVKNLDLDTFVDNAIKVEEGQLETLRPPPIEPEDLMIESNVTFADDEKEEWIPQPTPPKTPTPTPKTPTPPPKEPTPTPPKTPTPPPKTPTPPPKEPTPPPKTPTPPRTPTPPPKEPTPPSSPQPKTLTAAELAAQKRRAYSEEAWRRYQEYQKQWKKFRQTQRNAPANPKHAKTPGDEHEESEQRSGTTSPALTDTTSRPSSSMDNQTSVTPSNSNISASSHFSRIRTSVTPEPFGDNQNGIRSRTASVSSSRKSPISIKSPQPSHDVTKVIDEEKTAAKPEKIDIDTIEEPKTNIVEQRRRLFE